MQAAKEKEQTTLVEEYLRVRKATEQLCEPLTALTPISSRQRIVHQRIGCCLDAGGKEPTRFQPLNAGRPTVQ